MKLVTQTKGSPFTQIPLIVARLAKTDLEVQVLTPEQKNSAEWKQRNWTGKWPMLATQEGDLFQATAIAKYLAAEKNVLLGSSLEERAQVDQWVAWAQTTLLSQLFPVLQGVFGWGEILNSSWQDASKKLKESVKLVNTHLTNNEWLVGGKLSVADIVLVFFFLLPAQTVLDAGFRKAMGKFSAWMEKVLALPEVVAVSGHCKLAAKAVKPVTKADPKPEKKPQPVAVKKEEKKEEAKPKDPLDALPPSKLVLEDFKRLFMNHPDKKNGGIDEFMKLWDPEGYSMWFIQYDKLPSEGKEVYRFSNMLNGFLQRFDHFRRHCMARHLIVGDEPNLEIKGVWCFRGTGIPAELEDHPQWEYHVSRKMDLTNADDLNLLREYWAAVEETQCAGETCQVAKWHK